MKPGIYYGMSFKDYLAIPAINSSYLKGYSKTPAHTQLPDKDSKDLRFGRLLHTYVLEGERKFYDNHYVVGKMDMRKKDNKEKLARLQVENAGKELVDSQDVWKLKNMRDIIMLHPTSSALLKEGTPEITVVWEDPETGLPCKGRIDWLPKGDFNNVLVDLKKTKNASKYIFRRDHDNYMYFVSTGFYYEGYLRVTGQPLETITYMLAEDEPPWRVETYTMNLEYVDIGLNMCHKWLREEVKCREAGFYPPWSNAGADELDPPMYLKQKGDEE